VGKGNTHRGQPGWADTYRVAFGRLGRLAANKLAEGGKAAHNLMQLVRASEGMDLLGSIHMDNPQPEVESIRPPGQLCHDVATYLRERPCLGDQQMATGEVDTFG
jgi:hypothetical protein